MKMIHPVIFLALVSTLTSSAFAQKTFLFTTKVTVPIVCNSKVLSEKALSDGSLQVDIYEMCNTPNHSLKLSYTGGSSETKISIDGRELPLLNKGNIVIVKRSTPYLGTQSITIQNPGPLFEIESINTRPQT